MRKKDADFILSFLDRQFKQGQQISTALVARFAFEQPILESKLSDYIDLLREDLEVESFDRSAKDYLNDWCESRILRKTFNNSDNAIFSLTPEAEKAIAWMEDLQKRDDFVGTESRFLQIFDLLKEIQDHADLDAEMDDLYLQFYVDEDILKERIDRALERAVAITLTELIELYPVTQGVPEIVAYISIAARSECHSIDYNTLDSMAIPSLEPEKQLKLTLPQIVFRR